MKKINRKRLNNKGFTLVELLAVVILLALVVGFALPNVFDMIDNAKIKSIYNDSRTVVDSINKMYASDMIEQNPIKQKLGTNFINQTTKGNWICFQELQKVNNGGKQATLLEVLGITDTDLVMRGTVPTYDATEKKYVLVHSQTGSDVSKNTCSALRYNKTAGSYEVFFMSKEGGKYYVSSLTTPNYAFSRATASNKLITD